MTTPHTATVLTPTIGTPELSRAIASVQAQTKLDGVVTRHHIVIDGYEHFATTNNQFKWDTKRPSFTVLPDNTHKGEWYGHKIYGYFSQLIDTDYLFFLDEDNEYEPDHIASMLPVIDQYGFAWSKRKIAVDGQVIGNDTFEAIGTLNADGYKLIDTNCWGFGRAWLGDTLGIVGKWGADRQLTARMLLQHGYDHVMSACTEQYSVVYHAPDKLKQYFAERLAQ
jgi:hypothetical protein